MGPPPNAARYFAEKHLDAAYKHLSAIEDNLFKENQEDRRGFEKFYNNLALFSGGTIALSITFLGYLKSVGKPLHHQKLLTASWMALFLCLLLSLAYVLVTLYYSHHYREREWAEARKKKFETEMEEVPNMGVENVRTAQEIEVFRRPRKEAVQICTGVAEKHKKLQNRYQFVWVWSGRLAQLSFASGIGLLLWFAISNT